MTAALLPANPFRWSLRWATDVRTAADGTEQREALAVYPREAFSGSFYLPDASYATIRQMLSAGPAGLFELPLVHEVVASVNAITSTTITITATYAEWNTAGRRILVVGPSGNGYKTTISSVGGGGATLTVGDSPPGGESYPAGLTMIWPLENVLLEDGQQLGRWPVNAGRWSYSARQTTARAMAGTGASVTTFDGLPVLDRRPLGAEASERVRSGVTISDAGGAVAGSTLWDRSQHVRAGNGWRITGPADRQWWRAFLAGQRGQLGAFLFPTWRPDLTIDTQPSSGDSVIEVVEDYEALWWPSLAHRRLQFELTDGSVQYFAVDSATAGAITIDGTWPSAAAVAKVSFLETCRLESDVVTIEYGPGWIGRVSLAAVVVQEA